MVKVGRDVHGAGNSTSFRYIWMEQDMLRLALLFHSKSGTIVHFPAFDQGA